MLNKIINYMYLLIINNIEFVTMVQHYFYIFDLYFKMFTSQIGPTFSYQYCTNHKPPIIDRYRACYPGPTFVLYISPILQIVHISDWAYIERAILINNLLPINPLYGISYLGPICVLYISPILQNVHISDWADVELLILNQ